MWRTILFDLDGTLVDSTEGMIRSVQHALDSVGKTESDIRNLRRYIGPPLKQAFREYAFLSEEEAERAAASYREFYNANGMFIASSYPMVREMLYSLKRAGMTLGAVTSKETAQAVRTLQDLHLAQYFDVIIGCRPDETDVPKGALVEQALTVLGRQNAREEVVFVGDRYYDMQAARGAGIGTVGVTYGYGTAEELISSGAGCIAGNVTDLARLLLRGGQTVSPGNTQTAGAPATFGQKFLQILIPLLIWFGITNLISAIGGAVYGVIKVGQYASSGQDISNAGQAILQELMNSDMARLSMILSGISSVVVIPIMFAIYKKDTLRMTGKKTSLRAEKKPGAVNALTAFFTGLGISLLLNIIIAATPIAEWMYEMNPGRYDTLNSLPVWGMFIVTCLLAPVSEELIFRAVIFRRMRQFTGYMTAALVSAALFAVVHLDLVTGIVVFFVGILLAMFYEYTQSIFTSMILHFGFNLYSVLIELMHLDSMTEQQQTMAVILMLAAGVVMTAVGLFVFLKKNRNQA